MRDSPTVRPLLDRFVREILPFSHMHYGTEFSLDLNILAPYFSDAFLEAADRTVGWGCFSSDDAIAEGVLEDIAGFEKIVDGAFEALTPSEVDLRKQEEQRLALTNGEYSEHYAEHISDNDDGFTARQYLQAYVERVRVTVGWRHIKNHRHLERLRRYWLLVFKGGGMRFAHR